MSKISLCLWFDRKAEEAVKLYVSLPPDSRIEKCRRIYLAGPDPVGAQRAVLQMIQLTRWSEAGL